MSNKELISIIIPVYNIEGYLPKCLDTIARQTYSNLEIILVDDGSTDGSGLICDKFAKQDSRAVVFHHEKNLQLWAARNTGQAAAHGEYLMFVDGDDYLHLDAVRIAYEAINGTDRFDLALFGCKSTNCQNEDVISKKNDFGNRTSLSQEDLFRGIQLYSHVWGVLYRRSLLHGIFANNYSRCQDYDFNIRVFLVARKAVKIHLSLYYYVIRSDSIIHQEGAYLLGRMTQIEIIVSNLSTFPTEKKHLRFYLLKEIYLYFVLAIKKAMNTGQEERVSLFCRTYEKMVRRDFWLTPQIPLLFKIAYSINIYYPRLVSWAKKVLGNRVSWRMFGSF